MDEGRWYWRQRLNLFPDADLSGFAVAGCDPALGLAASLLPSRGKQRVVALQASSRRALQALEAGRIHGAVVHGPAEHTDTGVRSVARWTLARWKVGLAARPGTRIELEELAAGKLTLAKRDADAEAQQALERALQRFDSRAQIPGPTSSGHLDAARRVVYGSALVALTFEPAAFVFGLSFEPLEEHVVELLVPDEWVGHPGAEAFMHVIMSKPYAARLNALGGYDLPQLGRAA